MVRRESEGGDLAEDDGHVEVRSDCGAQSAIAHTFESQALEALNDLAKKKRAKASKTSPEKMMPSWLREAELSSNWPCAWLVISFPNINGRSSGWGSLCAALVVISAPAATRALQSVNPNIFRMLP